MSDERSQLDDMLGDLRRELDVAPSPEFEARVRERVATDTASSTRWWWIGAACAAIATAMLVVTMTPLRPRMAGDVAPAQTVRMASAVVPADSAGEIAAPVAPAAGGRTIAAARSSATSHAQRPVRSQGQQSLLDAPVIVPPGQEEALERLVVGLRSGEITRVPSVPDGPVAFSIVPLDPPEPIVLSAVILTPVFADTF